MLFKFLKKKVSKQSTPSKKSPDRTPIQLCAVDTLEERRLFASAYALGMNVNKLSSTTYPMIVNMLKDAGQRSVRLWAGFSSYDSRTANGVLKYAPMFKSQGFDVMVSLVPSEGQKGSYSQVTGMIDWLMNIPGLKESVDRWQIGNEPDHAKYWQYGVASYVTDFLKPAAEVLHQYGEKAVSAGPSWNPEDIKTMIKSGLLKYADFVGYHPYRNTLNDLKAKVAEVKALVGNVPLVASEWNVRGHESDVDPKYWADDIKKFFPVIAENFYAAYYFAAMAGTTKAGRAGVLKEDGSRNDPFYSAVKSLSVGFGGTNPVDPTPLPTTPTLGSIAGTSFNDLNSNGAYDTGDTLAGGSVIFLDANGNSALDTGEKSVSADSTGKFKFSDLAAGTYSVRRVFAAGTVISTALISQVLTAGQNVTGLFIGAKSTTTTPPTTPVLGSIAGTSFNDLNSNGAYDTGDTLAGGSVIFLDANGNSALDTGEKSVSADSTGKFKFSDLAAGTYNVRRVFATGTVISTALINQTLTAGQNVTGLFIGAKTTPTDPGSTPSGLKGSIAGLCFGDTDADGVFDAGETLATGRVVFLDLNGNDKLDTGETSVTTDSAGKYKFSDLDAGAYHVRRVFPTGWVSSTPLIDVTLAVSQVMINQNIGSKAATTPTPDPDPTPTPDPDPTPVPDPDPVVDPLTGSITGTCFGDSNADGVYDSKDSIGASKTVFIDSNGNGQLDAREKSVVTDSTGKFVFSGLAAGVHKVRRVYPDGWASSTPIADITVLQGQAITGVMIGSKAV